jgi:iron(III) transport system permease protein
MDNRWPRRSWRPCCWCWWSCCCSWSSGRSGARVLPPAAAPRRHQPTPGRCLLRGGARWLAWLVCGVPVLMGFVLPVLFMLRPLAAEWDLLAWASLRMVWQQPAPGADHRAAVGGDRAGAGVCACAAARPCDPRRGAAGRPGLCGAGRGDRGGLLLPVGWLQAAAPQLGVGYSGDGHVGRSGLGLPGALLCGGAAVGAKRLHTHPAELRRLGAHAGCRAAADGACALAAAASAPPPRRHCWCSST